MVEQDYSQTASSFLANVAAGAVPYVAKATFYAYQRRGEAGHLFVQLENAASQFVRAQIAKFRTAEEMDVEEEVDNAEELQRRLNVEIVIHQYPEDVVAANLTYAARSLQYFDN